MKTIRSAFLFAIVFLLFVWPASSQTESAAQITGTLTDLSGAALASVHITSQPEGSTGAPIQSISTSADGSGNSHSRLEPIEFSFPSLPLLRAKSHSICPLVQRVV